MSLFISNTSDDPDEKIRRPSNGIHSTVPPEDDTIAVESDQKDAPREQWSGKVTEGYTVIEHPLVDFSSTFFFPLSDLQLISETFGDFLIFVSKTAVVYS